MNRIAHVLRNDMSLVPGEGVKTVCPSAAGLKNWLPASYNPSTKTMIVPMVEACMDLIPVAPAAAATAAAAAQRLSQLEEKGIAQ